MKIKKYKLLLISIGVLIVIVITIFFYLTLINKTLLFSVPINGSVSQTDFCDDSDINSPDQSKTFGGVLYIHRDEGCSWDNLNRINLTSKNICAFSLFFNDYCVSNKILKEKVCENNMMNSKYITCLNSCKNGVCY